MKELKTIMKIHLAHDIIPSETRRNSTNMNTWNLNDLYNGFDEGFDADVAKLESFIKTSKDLALNLKDASSLNQWLSHEQELMKVLRNTQAYVSLVRSVDSTNTTANSKAGQIMGLVSNLSVPHAQFNQFIADHKEDLNTWYQEDALIKEHKFLLENIVKGASHNLSDEVEEAVSKLSINAGSNWSSLHSHLTSNTTIDFRGETHTLTSLRNLATSDDAQTRKDAYLAELEISAKMEDSIAFALNSIKGEVNEVSALRQYASPLEKTLEQSYMTKETLNALMSAIEKYTPEFRRYLKHKAKLLGHEGGLPFYDLFAPFESEVKKSYTIKESQTFIVDSFRKFSDDLADMTDTAYNNGWIDFLPREGKRGGAFCMNLPQIKQSRIMTNFDGSTSSVVTMAHELGHAYHGLKIQNNSLLNTRYSMPVAETASTFCENIILNAAIEAASPEEKLILLENSLQDSTQIIVDIASRYKFESEAFRRRQNEFLSAQDFKDIMIQAQKDTYGDGLDENALHPYMWLNKGHYYSPGLSFYNFPYAYGGLFAIGLYAKFEEEGAPFVEQYGALLTATTTMNCEDVGKLANIDVTDVKFWESSLDQIVKRIDEFIELTPVQ